MQGVFEQHLVTLIERLKIVCPEGFCKKFASNLLERPYLFGGSFSNFKTSKSNSFV